MYIAKKQVFEDGIPRVVWRFFCDQIVLGRGFYLLKTSMVLVFLAKTLNVNVNDVKLRHDLNRTYPICISS